jgi:pimeloyl-ACP methyl ester carboxylesterase
MSDLMVTAHDGIELAVRDHGGDGPDVLFVHGAMRTLEDWAPVLGNLSGVRAVAMDLRYHGRSGVPAGATQADFVRDIETVADQVGLSDPFVIGHSYGGVLALEYAAAHAQCPGVMNIDGFDFRQRELFIDVEPAAVDTFLREFRFDAPPDAGDEAWLDEQRAQLSQMAAAFHVPDDVTAAAFDRSFVRAADGWKRRPPNSFFDVVYAEDGVADPLAPLRRIEGRVVYVVCRPPGEAGLFAQARAGLERHVGNIAAERPNVRLETIDATHFVIVEKPDAIAALISSLVRG